MQEYANTLITNMISDTAIFEKKKRDEKKEQRQI